MTKLPILLAGAALALAGGLAWAQDEAAGDGHGDHMMEGMADDHRMPMSDDPAMQALMAPMHQMMLDMPMASTGDADADFLLMMIPHHQSAIDMARVVLEQGDDEETRALAQAVIEVQEAEIAEMQAMLRRLGVEPPAPSAATGD